MRRFRIGEIVLCKCPEGFLEPGEIVETVTKNGRTEIVVRFPDDEKIWKQSCRKILLLYLPSQNHVWKIGHHGNNSIWKR